MSEPRGNSGQRVIHELVAAEVTCRRWHYVGSSNWPRFEVAQPPSDMRRRDYKVPAALGALGHRVIGFTMRALQNTHSHAKPWDVRETMKPGLRQSELDKIQLL